MRLQLCSKSDTYLRKINKGKAHKWNSGKKITHLGVGAPQSHLNIESFEEVNNSVLRIQMKLSRIVTALMTPIQFIRWKLLLLSITWAYNWSRKKPLKKRTINPYLIWLKNIIKSPIKDWRFGCQILYTFGDNLKDPFFLSDLIEVVMT